ncbi:MAG: pectate lyase [Verrucomicrobiota bacterium]
MQLNRRTRTSALLSLGLVVVMGITSLPAVEGARQYLKRPDAWYAGEEAKRIGTNILSFQSDLGGWPKNVDTTAAPYDGSDRAKNLKPTFDNGATTDELRFLAQLYTATQAEHYRKAFEKGYDHSRGRNTARSIRPRAELRS